MKGQAASKLHNPEPAYKQGGPEALSGFAWAPAP